MIWTDERVELLQKLWSEGFSAAQIARQFDGISRNAVIGKLHRLGRRSEHKPVQVRPQTFKAATVAPLRRAAAVRRATPYSDMPVRFVAQAVGPEAPGLATLSTLESHMCKWPIGDPAANDFTFCGQSPSSGRPYCDRHARTAYRPAPGASTGGADLKRLIARYA